MLKLLRVLTQVAHARRMVAVAGEALTYQGAQTTVTKTMITDLNEAITSGKTALDAIKNSDDYNAAQVTALNKAIAQAQDVVDIYNGKYSSSYNKVNHASVASVGDKDGIVASDITGAIDAIDAAINYSEIIMGWSKNDAGKWMYGTEEGYLNNGWNKIGSRLGTTSTQTALLNSPNGSKRTVHGTGSTPTAALLLAGLRLTANGTSSRATTL